MAAKKKRQSYTMAQREAVLADVPTIGVSATARKHGVPQTSVSGWLRARSREGLTVAATIVSNSSYGLVWYFIIRNPAINRDLNSPVAVWSPAVLTILAEEAAAVVLILGLTLYVQSRKREFV